VRCNWSMDDDPGEAQGSGRKQKEAEGSRREGSGLVSGSWRKSGVRNQRSNECETVSGVRCADHGVRCALCAVRCALCAVRCALCAVYRAGSGPVCAAPPGWCHTPTCPPGRSRRGSGAAPVQAQQASRREAEVRGHDQRGQIHRARRGGGGPRSAGAAHAGRGTAPALPLIDYLWGAVPTRGHVACVRRPRSNLPR
jgi:hypothetical protein